MNPDRPDDLEESEVLDYSVQAPSRPDAFPFVPSAPLCLWPNKGSVRQCIQELFEEMAGRPPGQDDTVLTLKELYDNAPSLSPLIARHCDAYEPPEFLVSMLERQQLLCGTRYWRSSRRWKGFACST